MKVNRFFMITLLTVIGASSLHADAAVDAKIAKLEARLDAVEKEVKASKVLKISQEDFMAHSGIQEEIGKVQNDLMKKAQPIQAQVDKDLAPLKAKYDDAKPEARPAIEKEMMPIQQKAMQKMQALEQEMQTRAKQIVEDKVKQANQEAKKLGYEGGIELSVLPVAKDHVHYNPGQKLLAILKKGIQAVESGFEKAIDRLEGKDESPAKKARG